MQRQERVFDERLVPDERPLQGDSADQRSHARRRCRMSRALDYEKDQTTDCADRQQRAEPVEAPESATGQFRDSSERSGQTDGRKGRISGLKRAQVCW